VRRRRPVPVPSEWPVPPRELVRPFLDDWVPAGTSTADALVPAFCRWRTARNEWLAVHRVAAGDQQTAVPYRRPVRWSWEAGS